MAKKVFKERAKRLKLPGLYWDNQQWVKPETYPGYVIYTDAYLAQTLMVSRMRVGMWRAKNVIPFTMSGNFPVYRLNEVLQSLQRHGYQVDPNLKSREL